jgi:hypothetical protein
LLSAICYLLFVIGYLPRAIAFRIGPDLLDFASSQKWQGWNDNMPPRIRIHRVAPNGFACRFNLFS